MTTPLLGHLDPQFLEIMTETQEMLRQVFRTTNRLTFPVSATGMAGMETCLVNLLEPGDKVVVCAKGFFGKRMIEVAGRTGAEVTVLERPWGQVFDLDQIRDTLQEGPAEGARHRPRRDVDRGAGSRSRSSASSATSSTRCWSSDAVTSLGCVPVKVDEWEIDAVYSCTQKGLGCPPGLSPVSVQRPGRRGAEGPQDEGAELVPRPDADRRATGAATGRTTTPAPITMIYALREGLRLVLEEGLEARWARHVRNHKALKAGLAGAGLDVHRRPRGTSCRS